MWLRKADFVTGIGLVLFGLVVLVLTLGFRWDLPPVQQSGWYTAPGLLPMAVAVVLVLQGASLTLHAVRAGAGVGRSDLPQFKRFLTSEPSRRAALVALLLSVYVFGLVGRIHFTLASFLFLVGFMFAFKAGAWWKIVLVSAIASAAVSYGFSDVAGVPLP